MTLKIKPFLQEFQPKIVAIDMSAVPDLEYTALKMLIQSEKRQRENGVRLWLVVIYPTVLSVIHKSPLGEALGHDAMHFNLEIAVAKYLGKETTAAGTV